MWVRSLSLPPPHPLVLTGKGRSFLQPKLPTLPLRPFPLSVCALCFPYYQKKKKWGSLLLLLQIFVVACCIFGFSFLVLCTFLGGVGTLLSFMSCIGIVYRFTGSFFFFSAVICMVLCISNLGYVNTRGSHYTTCTFTGFTPSLFLHERPLNITKSVCTSPWCPTPLKSSCPSLHIWSSLWPAVLLAAGYTDAAFACVHCKYAHICVCVQLRFSSPSHHSSLSSPSGEEEVAHGMKVWRKALTEVRSAAQLAMCIQQLQKSIAWERSIMKVVSSRNKIEPQQLKTNSIMEVYA